LRIGEIVVQNDVGPLQAVAAADRDQTRIAGASADEIDDAGGGERVGVRWYHLRSEFEVSSLKFGSWHRFRSFENKLLHQA
jgi:hypothetical protein